MGGIFSAETSSTCQSQPTSSQTSLRSVDIVNFMAEMLTIYEHELENDINFYKRLAKDHLQFDDYEKSIRYLQHSLISSHRLKEIQYNKGVLLSQFSRTVPSPIVARIIDIIKDRYDTLDDICDADLTHDFVVWINSELNRLSTADSACPLLYAKNFDKDLKELEGEIKQERARDTEQYMLKFPKSRPLIRKSKNARTIKVLNDTLFDSRSESN